MMELTGEIITVPHIRPITSMDINEDGTEITA